MAEVTALIWSERLLALAVLLQSVEHLQNRRDWGDSGIWRWATLRGDFRALPLWLRRALDAFLCESGFHALLSATIAAAGAVLLAPLLARPAPGLALAVLFLGSWLSAIRWRGTFNGGSDSMTVAVALSLCVARAFGDNAWVGRACLAYVAIQVTASYFIAGSVKLRNPKWRQGTALPALLQTPGYDSPSPALRALLERPAFAHAAGIGLVAFECAFPLAWTDPQICLAFLALAVAFHLVCFRALGLNRFFFAWLSAYPALFFWSGYRGH